jgi:S-adenosylmethionine decarboxylase
MYLPEPTTLATISKPFNGLHIIANLASIEVDLLRDFKPLQTFLNQLIAENNLKKVGEVYHSFPNAGYTAVIGLTESHLSIHTWPELEYITFDIFVSNYLKDNTYVTRHVYEETKKYFKAQAVIEQMIDR